MTFAIHLSGHVKSVVEATLPGLVADLVASGVTAGDSSLWGPAAEDEASRRLGWVQAVSVSRPLVPEIVALRDELWAKGVTRVVLAGMGGSSLAPEVIAQTAGVPLVILDSTAPGQVLEDEGVSKFIVSWHELKDTVANALASATKVAG